MKFLFVKTSLVFPRRSGHDVHCFSMMKALSDIGHEINLLTQYPTSDAAVADVPIASLRCFEDVDCLSPCSVRLGRLQERFCSYWGVDVRNIDRVAVAASDCRADVVVVVGLEVLPYLAGVTKAKRIWYAADEWMLHHASLVFPTKPATWLEFKPAMIKGLYERVYASCVDRVWVVSDRDARAVRWVMGSPVDVAPNGVDFTHYRRESDSEPLAKSCVFWGRLDFAPNIDAIEWFCEHVWQRLKTRSPEAKFNVYGFAPSDKVRELSRRYQFELVPDLADIRSEITKNQIVVLPFVSGAGIKNKLLEAAALSMPIVASPRVVDGLSFGDTPPMVIVRRAEEWVEVIDALSADAAWQSDLGKRARDWVEATHSWQQAAETVVKGLSVNSR